MSTSKRKGSTVPVTVSLYPREIELIDRLASRHNDTFSGALRAIISDWQLEFDNESEVLESGKEKE